MPLVFSKSLVWVLSTLLWPGSPQRERIAVDTELWCTLHVWSAICERFNPSTCRCGAFECRPLAQIEICGMRQLNRGGSSRFRIHLDAAQNQTGLKLNRWTSTLDVGWLLTFGPTWPITTELHLLKSLPRFLATRSFFFPARFAEVWTCVSSNLWPF